jgi:Flp pilus assembly protein TadG
VLPVLVLILFGIIEFGRGYNAKVELTAAVREGARAAALSSADPVTATRSAAPGLPAASIGVTVVASCPASGVGNASVKATYPFTYSVPFFGARTVTINATGVMRCGG